MPCVLGSLATLECELIERVTFDTKSDARLSVFEFIEGWYNPDRLHSGLGYLPPHCYEELLRRIATKKSTIHETILILRNLVHLSRRESRRLSTKAGQLHNIL
jgi:hypothetical protein